jgi:hypothetical protein
LTSLSANRKEAQTQQQQQQTDKTYRTYLPPLDGAVPSALERQDVGSLGGGVDAAGLECPDAIAGLGVENGKKIKLELDSFGRVEVNNHAPLSLLPVWRIP